jgi:hypothetical protein
MPTREELHKLIDSLSEDAMQTAYRVFSFVQSPSISGDMRHLLQTQLMGLKPLMKPGTAPEFGGGSHYDSDRDSGTFSSNYWDGDAYVQETYHRHHGHPLAVIERICILGGRLIYKCQVRGPGDKRDEREVVFDL